MTRSKSIALIFQLIGLFTLIASVITDNYWFIAFALTFYLYGAASSFLIIKNDIEEWRDNGYYS